MDALLEALEAKRMLAVARTESEIAHMAKLNEAERIVAVYLWEDGMPTVVREQVA